MGFATHSCANLLAYRGVRTRVNIKAEYGSELLDRLSKDLSVEFGKGFSRSNLFQVRQFYLKFSKIQTLSGQLTWSHYTDMIKADNDLEVSFYVKQCEKENWSLRELKRQMKGVVFYRLALSKNTADVLEIALIFSTNIFVLIILS